jgi:hypothetical protein
LTANAYAVPPEKARRGRAWNAVLRQRFAAAESLALVIYPKERLDLELMAIDAVATSRPRRPRACRERSCDTGVEAFDMLYPGFCRPIHADEWLAILASVPVTLDDTALGRLVAMGEAARRFISDETAEERVEFRHELLDAARGTMPYGPIGSTARASGKTAWPWSTSPLDGFGSRTRSRRLP